ncbi:PREDICTED: TBC1 domain family member 14 [Condylura cristata]|uniref:TBC1 domain family member 14 n=1 Tax=Condylura cristata TaxID=143302 RepID=UPI000642FBC1|nr:PREDICTED: TBC1 domain family member 14 [Condylura cristata]
MNSAEQTVTWLITLGVLESPKKTISDPEGFLQASLKDGVVLCRLLERLLPGTIESPRPRVLSGDLGLSCAVPALAPRRCCGRHPAERRAPGPLGFRPGPDLLCFQMSGKYTLPRWLVLPTSPGTCPERLTVPQGHPPGRWTHFQREPQEPAAVWPESVSQLGAVVTVRGKEYEDKAGRPSKQNVRKSLDFEPLSTTALILEDRPAAGPEPPRGLPLRAAWSAVAQSTVAGASGVRSPRAAGLACTLTPLGARPWSPALTQAMLLSRWCSRKVRDLWWQGIPPSVRGKVWSLAIGNELNITHELFDICLARAKERWRSLRVGGPEASDSEDAGFPAADREASLELIKLDISRTFPNLCIFQQGGPYHDMLHSILGAYTCYRPDVGYVQGMSFVAAVLTLNLDAADAFIAFSNLLNKPCQMAFFRVDHGLMLTYFAAFEVFFEENLPKLFAHFKKNNLTPDIYLIDCRFRGSANPVSCSAARAGQGEAVGLGAALSSLAGFLHGGVLTALQKDSREAEKGSPSPRH